MNWIYGAYGVGNLGDDLLLYSALTKWGESCKVVSYGKPEIPFEVEWIHFKYFLNNFMELIKPGDVFIVGGGGVFWSKDHILQLNHFVINLKKIGCRVIFDCIGTQGSSYTPKVVQNLIDLSDDFSVRDYDCIRELKTQNIKTHKVKVKKDLSFDIDYSKFEKIELKSDLKSIGLNYAVPHHDLVKYQQMKNVFCRISDKYSDEFKFFHIEHTIHKLNPKENDSIVSQDLNSISNGQIVGLNPKNIQQLIGYYKNFHLTIGFRYHMSAISVNLGISNLALCNGYGKYFGISEQNNTDLLNIRILEEEDIFQNMSSWIETNR